jgi:GalNAc-alpha-(1->4)-GalNAc-alpha-(1->3)-diNAcBac-PP-undecaprenol alpha-1,4-N-acetyl-D-galactosaminyltransferase
VKKKLTLLFTIPTLRAGGAERVLVNLLNYWAEKNFWNIILVVHDDSRTPPFYPVHPNIKLIHTGFWRKHQKWRVATSLYKILKTLKPDGVVSFILWNNILTLLAAKAAQVPCIVAERNSPHIVKNPITKILRRWTHGWAKQVVVQTKRAQEMFPPEWGPKISIIPNPVFVGKIPVDYGAKKIVAVGRLCQQKGFDILIQAFDLVEKHHKGWTLMIWGEGPHRKNLASLIGLKKLQEKVHLHVPTQKIDQEMARGSIFVLSSRFEGIPNVLCEAMALGMAAISTDCPTGPRELITPLENGLLVPVDDIKALAEAMERLIVDKKMREDFGKKAAQSMKKYDIKNIAPLWEREFQKFFKG